MRNLLAFRKASAATVASVVVLAGCGHQEPERAPSERSSAMVVASIPPTPVSGAIDGQRFGMREAWYRVVRKLGRQRIDLIISEGRPTRLCNESDPELARHVWVRFPQWQHFAIGEYRVDPGADAPLSVHYEAPDERVWAGNGTASAVVAIDAVTTDSVTGRIRACFGDHAQSCVTGSFHALECRNELDPDGPNAGNIRRRATQDAGAEP